MRLRETIRNIMKKCTETAHDPAAAKRSAAAEQSALNAAAAPAKGSCPAAAKPAAAPAQSDLSGILAAFAFEDEIRECRPYGNGHINETYRVETNAPHAYILQKINRRVFSNVPGLMRNIAAVTAYLRR